MAGPEPPEVPSVADVLSSGRHCLECIAHKTGIRVPRVTAQINYIATLMPVVTERARCDQCARERDVYTLG
jgi:hypothetical protein